MKTITLTRTATEWLATWHGPEAAQIQELFGTTTLPTAFTAAADPETVRRDIAAHNPEYTVEVYA